MGSRNTIEGGDRVYAAAEQWVERALRTDDSLFTPGKPIWTGQWLGEIHQRFLNHPDDSADSFYDKLQRQLADSPPEVYQLMAEVLYIHLLFVHESSMKMVTKRNQINDVLKWSEDPVTIPEDLEEALAPGLGGVGQGFFSFRPWQVGFLIEFAERWKKRDADEREALLRDPWAFKEFLYFAPSSLLLGQLAKGDGYYRSQREMLLHFVFPDVFEKIHSVDQKHLVARAFSNLVTEPTEDVDRRLEQIRHRMESDAEEDIDFYDEPIRRRWDPAERDSAWDKFVGQAQTHWDSGQLDPVENDYKIEIGRQLAEARQAVNAEADDWVEVLTKSFPANPGSWRSRVNFLDWVGASKEGALRAIQTLWREGEHTIAERIRDFSELFPKTVASGTGVRMRTVSVLLMGIEVFKYPPFMITKFQEAYRRTGHDQPDNDADEATLYSHALAFLDRFIEEAGRRGLALRHRLDAQSLVWMILQDDPPPPPGNGTLSDLAKQLTLEVDFLEEINILLKEKKQVIFQGPPGTGKTYVAQKLAAHLAGSMDRMTLVQFHPSYAYEDFVQGYRPSLLDGQPGFELQDGPLLQAARRAREAPDADHFLIIDEINRGNLAKIFGELYFLLEYRDRSMNLQYQADEEFSLPGNLYIIGTMNTADRSIAMVDLALRRRFYFVEFHPDDEPIKGLLRRWLTKNASGMEWVADVLEKANRKLANDRHVAIGPSYFMGTDDAGDPLIRDEVAVSRIWQHSVLPYVEEHLFGNQDDMAEWELDKLRQPREVADQEGNRNEDATEAHAQG